MQGKGNKAKEVPGGRVAKRRRERERATAFLCLQTSTRRRTTFRAAVSFQTYTVVPGLMPYPSQSKKNNSGVRCLLDVGQKTTNAQEGIRTLALADCSLNAAS